MFFCGKQWTSQCLTQQSGTEKDTIDTWRSTHPTLHKTYETHLFIRGPENNKCMQYTRAQVTHNLSVWMRERLDMDGRAKWKAETGGREIFYLLLTFEGHLWIAEGHRINWHFLAVVSMTHKKRQANAEINKDTAKNTKMGVSEFCVFNL